MKFPLIGNYIVGGSNLLALYYGHKLGLRTYEQRLVLYVPMLASLLYHLSEVSHELEGVYPLKLYCAELLVLDRLCAVASALSVLKEGGQLWSSALRGNSSLIVAVMVAAVISVLTSEMDMILKPFGIIVHIGYHQFVAFHVVWHACAFYLLARAVALMR
jgi:hypothetical protein